MHAGRFSRGSDAGAGTTVHENETLAHPLGPRADPVEAALAVALERASAAGEWATVVELARELAARRGS
jgi:hypothetical protein